MRKAILAFGAPAFLAGEAHDQLKKDGVTVDVHIVNGLPLPAGSMERLATNYPEGIVTIEDGLIGSPTEGWRGFAGVVRAGAGKIPLAHIGITDPRVAPSDGHMEVWNHFGISTTALVEACRNL